MTSRAYNWVVLYAALWSRAQQVRHTAAQVPLGPVISLGKMS